MNFAESFELLGGNLEHFMPDDGSGVYIKRTDIPAGVRLDMHTHTFTHKSVLCTGRVMLTVGDEIHVVDGPAVLSVVEGVPHAVLAMTDAVWLCIHSTDELDRELIDHALVNDKGFPDEQAHRENR